MKFIFLKWRAELKDYSNVDLNPCGEVIFNVKLIAEKYGLELISFRLVKNNIQIFLYGEKCKVKLFAKEFSLGFRDYLKLIYKSDLLSDIYLLREVGEDSPVLLEAIKNELFIRNISKHFYAEDRISRAA